MKLSLQATNHILVKATCQSEWDNCDFAIIFCGESWIKWLQQRLNAAQADENFEDFQSLRFFDSSVEFYVSNEDEVDALLEDGEEWAFVELEDGEGDGFTIPESRLDCYSLSLYHNGLGRYSAYGKHTGEEYYTQRIPFGEIISKHQEIIQTD